jgi:Iron-containing alcohol dehydrogenase
MNHCNFQLITSNLSIIFFFGRLLTFGAKYPTFRNDQPERDFPLNSVFPAGYPRIPTSTVDRGKLTMASSIILPNARQRALRLMGSVGSHSSTCPCHANTSHTHLNPRFQTPPLTLRKYATPADSSKEYAFEMAVSSIRFGEGCTLEVGMDVQNMGIRKLLVLTDSTVAKLLPMKNTIQSLEEHGVNYEIFDKCRIEPKDYS